MRAYFIFFSALLFILISCKSESKSLNRTEIINTVSEVNTSGSGYRELEGKFIEYEYVDFGSFRLAIYDNRIKWRGYGGYFDGITSEVEPQISKISEHIYFLSWVFGDSGGDNVVVNFKTKKVYAHLRSGNASENSPSDFEMIHGTVKCGPSIHCEFPEGEPISMLRMILKLNSNTKKYELPTIFETKKPLIEEHLTARKELSGKTFIYDSEEGLTSIKLDENITWVSLENKDAKQYQTNITKISDGIYFLSWLGNSQFGEHIVLNTNTMKVFDHLTNVKLHEERIYKLNDISN
ncbi:conserved hypothetical protein [Tenacibaculum sp. 190524A05c]